MSASINKESIKGFVKKKYDLILNKKQINHVRKRCVSKSNGENMISVSKLEHFIETESYKMNNNTCKCL